MARNTKSVFGNMTEEDLNLEHLGYQQEMKRSFGQLEMLGFSFNLVTCWTALTGVFIIGVQSGGPPVMLYSWIGTCLFTAPIALAMAEMCARWPVAGGQYSWVAALAPRRLSRQLSYITGWFLLVGVVSMGAAINSFIANYILGLANLVYPSYIIQRWHTVLVDWLVVVFSLSMNTLVPHLLHYLSRFALVWNVGSFFVIMITLLASNHNKRNTEFVWRQFQNSSGFDFSMTVVLGIVESLFGMCCYDTPSHMAEDMTRPKRDAPRATIWSVALGSVTGFAFLITLCYCIGDIQAAATTPTGVPFIQIIYESTQSKLATCILASMTIIINLIGVVNLLAEGSRSIYAFARDSGLPFSRMLSKVEQKRKIPVYAILLAALVQVGENAIYFGTVTGFNTVVTIASTGFYVSYSMPLLARILGHYYGQPTDFAGPYSLPVPVSLTCSAVGFLFLWYAIITFNFPTESPVNSVTMNYTCAAMGLVALLSAVTWFTVSSKSFTGPADVRNLSSESQGDTSSLSPEKTSGVAEHREEQ